MFRVFLCVCVLHASAIIVTDPPPTTEYNFWYDIVDPSTGDAKSLQEIRQGDVVRGSYSVLDPDGIKRIVDYTADSKSGFKAIVRQEPVTYRPQYYNPYSTPRKYIPARNPYKHVSVPKVFPLTFTNSNSRQTRPFFTPGNDTGDARVTFNRGEFFMPNYIRH